MRAWNYRVIAIEDRCAQDMQDGLNAVGEDAWELVAFVDVAGQAKHLIFKRPRTMEDWPRSPQRGVANAQP